MPSILFYALEPELHAVVDHLSEDPDVAFILPAGRRRWRATDRVVDLPPGHHALWLRANGPLPLIESTDGEAPSSIADPMAGWEERVAAATPGLPFFGSDPGVVWRHLPRFDASGLVPMSAFGWIGDRYRGTGQGATTAATRWWRRLQRWIRARTDLVRRGGPTGVGPKDVAAFPEALARLQSGASGELNPPTP